MIVFYIKKIFMIEYLIGVFDNVFNLVFNINILLCIIVLGMWEWIVIGFNI